MAVVVAPAPAQAAPPSNDDFANAEVLPGVGIYTGTNVDATTETGEPNRLVTDVPPPFNNYAPTASVWYQWTAPDVAIPPTMQVSTRGSVATDGSDLDTVLAVYTGTDLTGLIQVAANDDFGGAATSSRVQFAPVRSTTYWIAVDSCCGGSPVAEGSIRLRLSETTGDGSIAGFVTDGALNPIKDICVVAVDDTGEQVSSQKVQTDVAGEYLLASVEAGPDRHLKFSNCGNQASLWAGQFNGGAQTLATAPDIVVVNGVGLTGVNETLVPGGSITGTVSADDTGYAGSLADICVRATMVGDPDDGFTRAITTAADGTYMINGLDGGDYQVTFAGNCGSNSNFASEPYGSLVTVTEGSTTSAIDAGLGAAPGAIAGTVQEWETGPGIQGICVRANSSSYTSSTVQTDSGGDYLISNVPAGTGYVVRFTDCNTPTNPLTTQWYNRALKQSRATSVTVNVATTTPDIDAAMFHAATIGGRLTDENGNPRDPACVNVYKDPDTTTPIDSVTADADGVWSTQVPPGNYKLEMQDCGGGGLSFETRWYHNQTSAATADLVFVDQGEVKTNLDQVLPGTPGTDGRIEGVVTDDTVAQNPLEGVCVSATSVGPPATTSTDALGRYSFDLPADSYVVEFTQCDPTKPYNVFPQYWDDVTSEGAATPVVVTSGTTTSGIVARMHPAGGVSGTVTHGSTPLQGICVSAETLGGTQVGQDFTDASGAYQIKGLATDSYNVSFEDCNYIYVSEWYNNQPFPDGTPDPVAVVEGGMTTGIDADLDRYGTISGTVTDAAGAPLADMCVVAYSPPGIFAFSATTDANGDYTIGALGDPNSPTPVQYAVNMYDCANVYGDAWWNNKLDYDSADLVDVTFGQDTPNIDAVLQDTNPANTAAPEARGRAVVGVGLRATNGTWDHDPRAFTFQWYRCQADGSDCQPLSAGVQREYVATVDDVGFRLRVDVTAQNNKGSTTAESALTDVVATASAPPNDDIEDRQDLTGSLPISVLGDNIDATRQPGEPDHLGIAAGASVWYEWTAPGGAPGRVTVNLDGSSFDTTLSVYDGTPTPFSGLHLVAENDDYQSMTSTATFAPTPGTTYYIAVDGYVDPVTHQVSEGTLDLRIDAATGIAGTVTAAAGGAPIRDICVTATDTPDPAPFGPSIETSADGSYFLELDPGTWYVDFYDCTGQYDEQWYDGVTDPVDATPVTVTSGSVSAGVDAAMVEAVAYGSISGTVTNEGGSPIPDICVVAATADSSSGGIGYTDQDGTYQVRGLGDPDNPGTALDYIVGFTDCGGFYGDEFYDNKLDLNLADQVPVTLDQDVTGIDATLQYLAPVNTAPPTIAGQASVGETLTADNGTWDHEPSLFSYEWYRCDADGTSNCVVQNSGVDPTYLLAASDEGHTIRVDVTAENSIGFTTASSAPTGVVDTAPPPNDDIQNRQVLSGAVPIAVTGTNVNATRQAGEPDHLGFTQGASVWYEWTAPSGGAALDSVRISVAASSYHTTLSVYGGTPVPFSGLSLVAENSAFGSPPGEVDFAPVAGTTYYIAVDGWYDGTSVAQGTVQLAISHSRGFAGTVTDTGGDPLQNICVTAFDDFGTPLADATTDANGDYQVVGLDPGDYKVRFSDCDLVYVDQWWDNQPDFNTANHVHVGANAITQAVDAAMVRYGTISGRWTDENGDPVYDPSCGAYAYDAVTGDFVGSGFTDVNGYYTIGGLQTGSYVVDFAPCTGGFGEEWWNNKLTQATATPISVTFGQDTGGIDVVLQDTAPVNTQVPVITGDTSTVGATLSASRGQWQHDPSTYAYSWRRCNASGSSCSEIAGADTSDYVTTASDVGHRLRVIVTATNSIGQKSVTSSATIAIGAPLPSVLPVLTGQTSVGSTLSVTTGTWTGSPTSYGYQWQRCSATVTNCTVISGVSTADYVLTNGDAGFRIRVVVTATNAAGSVSAPSNATIVVGAPSVTSLPVLTGQTSVGSTLSVTTGTWTGSPTSYGYQWQRCSATVTNCTVISGVSTADYVLTNGDAGYRIRVVVTATNAVGSVSAPSNATIVVGAPSVTSLPVLTGQTSVGSTLSVTTGTWTGSPTSYGYQWQRCSATVTNCTVISGVSTADYVLTNGDAGYRIRVMVTATNAAGSVSAPSNATIVVGAPNVAVLPVLTGQTSVGSTLSVTTGLWQSPVLTHAYQWQRCSATVTNCTVIPGVSTADYVLTTDDVGFRIRVIVTASNAAGGVSAPSNATIVIGAPMLSALPVLTGQVRVGSTLSVTSGSWGAEPTGYGYLWQRCSAAVTNCTTIPGASTADYVLTTDDVGFRIRVIVTASNAAGGVSAPSNATHVVPAA